MNLYFNSDRNYLESKCVSETPTLHSFWDRNSRECVVHATSSTSFLCRLSVPSPPCRSNCYISISRVSQWGGGGIGRSSSTELATMRIAVSRKRFGCVRVIGHSESVLEPYASSGYRGSARELTELHSLATRSTQDDFPIAHGRTVYRHSKMATIKGCSARLTSK